MSEINPKFQMNENGVLYLRCVKALHGHIEAASLFYDNLNATIQEKFGFKQNKYDPCVYNKRTIDGAVTIRVHVDDLKISSRSKVHLDNVTK